MKKQGAIIHLFEQRGGSGRIKSALTGREYSYDHSPDGRLKNRAYLQARQDESDFIAAYEKRVGREITRHELIMGIPKPQPAPQSETKAKPKGFEAAAEYLRERANLAPRAGERRAKERAAERIEQAGEEYHERKKAEAEREAFMSRPEMQSARKVADTMVGALEARDDIDQSLVDQAMRARQNLLDSGDVDQFLADSESVQQTLDAKFEERRAELVDRAKQQFAQARATMAEAKEQQ